MVVNNSELISEHVNHQSSSTWRSDTTASIVLIPTLTNIRFRNKMTIKLSSQDWTSEPFSLRFVNNLICQNCYFLKWHDKLNS